MTYRIGSLCTGYGGLDMAVESVLGGEHAWVADNDAGASKILAHRFPLVPNLGDITAVDWAAVEPVDILTAGFPCQDISCAGKRAGLREGTRSGLWSHVARAIAALRPPLVVIENVKELLSERADSDVEQCPWCLGDTDSESAVRALGAVLADLAEVGFDAEWVSVPAAAAGACHLRWRVFVLAWPAANTARDEPRWHAAVAGDAGRETGHRPGAGDRGALADAAGLRAGEPANQAHAVPGSRDARAVPGGRSSRAPADADDVVLAAETRGLAGRTPGWQRSYAGSDRGSGSGSKGRTLADPAGDGRHQVGAGPDLDGRRLAAEHGGGPAANTERGEFPREPPPQRGTGGGIAAPWDRPGVFGRYEAAVRRHERAFGRIVPSPVEPGRNGDPRLSPRFVEWMQGLREGWVTDVPGLSRNAQLKALGNGVVPAQAAMALRLLLGAVLAEASGAALPVAGEREEAS